MSPVRVLAGTLLEASEDAAVVLVGGIGLGCAMTPRDLAALPPPGGALRLYSSLHVREDDLRLYGFLDRADRDLFELLQGVAGVGARLAIACVSTFDAAALAAAIRAGDVHALQAVPGVGRRTAERIVVDLRDRMGDVALAAGAAGRRPVPSVGGDGPVRAALQALGFSTPEINEALGALPPETRADSDEALRAALQRLGR